MEPTSNRLHHGYKKQRKRKIHFCIIHLVGPDEYFHKPDQRATTTVSATGPSRPRLGHANEFAEAQEKWLAAQERRRQAALTAPQQQQATATASPVSNSNNKE